MLLISCSQEQAVDISMLQVDKGLAYLKDTDRLFTGTAVSYYENGQLQSEQHFDNGTLDGRNVFLDESGTLKLELNIDNSFLDGVFYSRDGDYIFNATFDHGVLIQRQIQYQLADTTIIQTYAENLLTTQELDSKGAIITITEKPFSDKNIATAAIEENMLLVAFAENAQLTGRLFYQNGDIIFQENYVNGLLDILLYHDQSADNKIYHCYYEGEVLEADSDEICTNLPIKRGVVEAILLARAKRHIINPSLKQICLFRVY